MTHYPIRTLVLATFLPLLSSGCMAAAPPLAIEDYVPTFSEDFDTLSVSPWGNGQARWIAHTPWHGDFGDARFADPQPDFPFTTDKGILRIEARKDAAGPWQGGLLSLVDQDGHGFAQKGGYFETRMKLPAGAGVWPAFWLIGVDRSHYTAEIDVMEFYGHDPSLYHATWHIWRKAHGGKDTTQTSPVMVDRDSLSTGFHTYGIDINESEMTWYLDRRQVWQQPTPAEFKTMAFYPLVDMALGGGWPSAEAPNPSDLYVDYVHIYRRKP